MAMLNGTANFLPMSHIESVQSVTPLKVTEPRLSRRVAVTESAAGSGIFRRCLHIILYYKAVSSEDSGWLLAGRMRESLGRTLDEQPMLAGRLRGGEEGQGELEIVSNDSGIRLFEARISTTLSEFFDFDPKEREEAEAELVFWKDIDDQNPQFSPLFNIQVTNFQCGGYSIGISSSLLLADPLAIISFLRRWANIHNSLVSESDSAKLPIFYLPNLKPNGPSLTKKFGSDRRGKTMIFGSAIKNLNSNDEMMHKALALQCVEEAESKLGVKMASKLSLLVKELSEEIKVEKVAREQKPSDFRSTGLTSATWDDLGASEVAFYEGNKPARVSYWINSISGEGLVILIPSPDESNVSEMKIIVTIPSET